MKLYYHETSGGAKYLFDTFQHWEHNGKSGDEGVINDKTRYVVRIDGDIRKDAELDIREDKIKTSMTTKNELTLFLSELKHTLVKYWIESKDAPTFNPKPYNIVSRNLTSIEKQIGKL